MHIMEEVLPLEVLSGSHVYILEVFLNPVLVCKHPLYFQPKISQFIHISVDL